MFKMAPENLDVKGFFTKKEWSMMPEEIRDAAKRMYVVYKQGKIEKPEFVTRYEEFMRVAESKPDNSPACRLQQQKTRMLKKLKNKKVITDGVEQCLKGFSQLEIDESARKKTLMDKVVRALEEEIDTGADSEPVYIKKRRLRRLKRVNYMELPEQEDDEYTWCDECDARFRTFCPVHGPLLVVPDDKTGDMELGCPPHVELRPSGIPGAGRGAWAAEPLPSGLRFGPYRGQVSSRPNPNSQYVWQVRRPNGGRQYVDGEKLSSANWLRYVNCSRNPSEQNLQAFQYKGQIFYRTVRNIHANTELLVWYGPQYAKLLNIDAKQYHAPLQGGSEKRGAPSSSSGTDPQPSTSKGGCTSVAGPQKKRWACGQCPYSSNRSSNLKQHSVTHTGEKPFSCDVCGHSFTHAGSLNVHKHTHTEEKPFSCDVCGHSFTHAGSLNVHKHTHTEEKPFSCDVCGHSFTRAGNLNVHKRTHTGEKPFSCDVCGHSFTHAGNLNVHKRTHTGEKPFSCDVCGHSFTHAGNLNVHKRTHTGEKPFSCDVCGHSFTHAGNLNEHKRIHTGEKPFSCDVCGHSFTHSNSLKIHKRTHNK